MWKLINNSNLNLKWYFSSIRLLVGFDKRSAFCHHLPQQASYTYSVFAAAFRRLKRRMIFQVAQSSYLVTNVSKSVESEITKCISLSQKQYSSFETSFPLRMEYWYQLMLVSNWQIQFPIHMYYATFWALMLKSIFVWIPQDSYWNAIP